MFGLVETVETIYYGMSLIQIQVNRRIECASSWFATFINERESPFFFFCLYIIQLEGQKNNLPHRESRLFFHLPEYLKKKKLTCPGQSGNRWCQALLINIYHYVTKPWEIENLHFFLQK